MSQASLKSLRPKKPQEERAFWLELEDMLQSAEAYELDEGYMKGSLSGESWKAFLKMVRDEVLERLEACRTEAGKTSGFCASSLGNYREEKRKIERAYLRNLAVLYKSAEKAYKTVSG